ncbi:MAG: DUF6703 family protein [Sporichthyaceae bacterium]
MAAQSKSRRTKSRSRPPARPAPGRPAPPAPAPVVNRVAAATAPALARLALLPKPVLPILVAVGVVAGLVLQGIAGLLILLFVVAILSWLLSAFWPMLATSGRVLRMLALVAVLTIGLLQL